MELTPRRLKAPLHSFHLKPETRNVKKVVKHTFFIRLFKNVQMQGAQDPRNEAYLYVR